MGQSKMKSFSPRRDENGNHRTKKATQGPAAGSTYWTFDVEFENGDSGEANSTSATPSWKTGVEYTYTHTPDEHGGKIKGMKMADSKYANNASQEAQGKQSYQKSPKEQKRISMQVAYEAATDIVISNIDEFSDESKYPAGILKSAIEANAKEFCDWIMKGTTTNEYITRSNALKRAIVQMEIVQFDISSKTKILERAEQIFRFLWT